MSTRPTRPRGRLIGLSTVRRALVSGLLTGLVGVAGLVLAPGVAHAQAAQTTGPLDRFDPAPAGDTFFSLPSADVAGRVRLAASAELSYAHDPLVLRLGSGGSAFQWVGDQVLVHAQLSLEVWRRLKLDLEVPILLQESGTTGSLDGLSVIAPKGAHVGDVRVGARVVLLHQNGLVPAAALSFSVWAPTGNENQFSGAGVYRYQPGVIIGAEYRHFVWGASAGTRFQPEVPHGLIGSQVVGGVGAAVRFVALTVGPELSYGVNLGDQRDAIVSKVAGTNAELLLAARYHVGPVVVGLAGGPGLGRGPGTPAYRLLAGITGAFDFLSPREPDDDSGNGTGTGAGAATPTPPVPAAPLDTDGDGVPDAEDACPTVVGDATPGAYRRGCPPDRDRDGIPDVTDACPDVPGVPSNDAARNGCPPDSDGDGITDDKDACPTDKGPPNADPKLNGCPTAVRIEGSQIVILQQVNFDTARATITQDSFTVLEQVAGVLRDHPEIARVAVDGHTDNRGADLSNKVLSQQRAVAVVLWLVEHGVDARRLEARGFGQRRPIAANLSTQGRAKNRRVEFLIRRRTPLGKAGWMDGPVPEDEVVAPAKSQ
jgi:OOP family OmpA-OmpF porin